MGLPSRNGSRYAIVPDLISMVGAIDGCEPSIFLFVSVLVIVIKGTG